MRKKLKEIQVVDLFCGVGGLTHGLMQSGLTVTAGFDIDEDCKFAYETNNDVRFIQRDVAELSPSDIAEHWSDSAMRVLAGCAPCQPFSTYSRTRKRQDSRWSLLENFSRLSNRLRPHVITIENVPQLANHRVFKKFRKELAECGYRIWWDIVDCVTIGIPQTRHRLVLLASLLGPLAMDIRKSCQPTTVEDAIGGLPPIQAGEISSEDPLHRACDLSLINLKRIAVSRPGGTWREWPDSLKASCHKRDSGSTYPSVYGRMEWGKPSPTITTQYFGYGNGRFGHPDQNRALSLREGAVLQTFPPTYQFESKTGSLATHRIGRLVGNAVPPQLGMQIGKAISKHCDAYSHILK